MKPTEQIAIRSNDIQDYRGKIAEVAIDATRRHGGQIETFLALRDKVFGIVSRLRVGEIGRRRRSLAYLVFSTSQSSML